MIVGKSVILREFRQEDLDGIQAWVNNSRIRKFLAFSVFPQTREESQDYLNRQLRRQSDQEITFAICLKDDPERKYIGGAGLHQIDYLHRHAEVGICIGREDLHGRGIGREALELLCAFGFLRLGLHKINLRCFAYNKRGEACYRKVGFREAGRLRENVFLTGNSTMRCTWICWPRNSWRPTRRRPAFSNESQGCLWHRMAESVTRAMEPRNSIRR